MLMNKLIVAAALTLFVSAGAWAIPMHAPQSNDSGCGDSCLEDTGASMEMYEVKWLATHGSMAGFDAFRDSMQARDPGSAAPGNTGGNDLGDGDSDGGDGVPEPGPLALLGLGFVLLSLRRKFSR